jgi:hypothetical protein
VYYFLPIEQFWDTKEISQLPCYPLQFFKDGDQKEIETLCESLKIRGEKYSKIVRSDPGKSQMYIYDGPALSETRSVVQRQPRDSVRPSSPVHFHYSKAYHIPLFQGNDNGRGSGSKDLPTAEDRRKTALVRIAAVFCTP